MCQGSALPRSNYVVLAHPLANKLAYPLSTWLHLVKTWDIEDLGSQPTKHPYFQLSKPCGSWLLANQAFLHISSNATLSLQTEAHILSLKNEPYKKPLAGKGQKWRGITSFYWYMPLLHRNDSVKGVPQATCPKSLTLKCPMKSKDFLDKT